MYQEIRDSLKQGRPVLLETRFTGESGKLGSDLTRRLLPLPAGPIEPVLTSEDDSWCMQEPMTPRERLIVLGGGHISLPLCSFAAQCGFAVTEVDDRPYFANEARFPTAEHIICDSFPEAIASLTITPYDYVVIITRGHRFDGDCIRALFQQGEPAYLGMIGSRRRTRGLKDMLAEEGFSRERLERICTPIGLPIGAITPGELAISILSEVISYRRLPEKKTHEVNSSDLEQSLIDYLAENKQPQAIVTVLSTKGSTPRQAGAKMSVNAAGQVTGSIGGGCSEGAVIQTAVRMIGTGTYRTMDIDMTGDVAENEGMVCGGIMKVLIEDGTETE